MNDKEREAVRKAGAEDARRSRAEHGLPERIEDPAAVAALVAILRDRAGATAPKESTRRHGRKPAA